MTAAGRAHLERVATVLHLSSSSGPGGAESVVAGLAANLDESRYRSVVCLFRDGWLRHRCEALGLETHVLPMAGMLDLGWLRRFRRVLKGREISLIHAHEFGANTYGTLAGILSGVPVIATVHGRNYYIDCSRRRVAYRVVSRVATMVAVSEDVKRFVVERAGVPARLVDVVHNGIPRPASVPQETRARLRDELGLDAAERVILVVGSLYPVKGHRYLLAAVPSVLDAWPTTTVLVAGRGALEEVLREQARDLGIEARVRFLGLREDVPALLSLCDVFVLPSLSEGLSIAILEAMAAARPIVTTRVGGNPELVVNGETGLLVAAADPPALASAVTELLANPEEARRLGENGKRRLCTRFTVEGMVAGYEAIYARRLAARARASGRGVSPGSVVSGGRA